MSNQDIGPRVPSVRALPLEGLGALSERVEQYFERTRDGHATKGAAPKAGDLILSTNDYLALAGERRIVDARIEAMERSRQDVYMSAVYLTDTSGQRAFEARMAEFLGAEDTILCQSGWCANDGLVQALSDALLPIYIDIFAHMSLWQGAQSAGVKARPFRHNNVDHLRGLIEKNGRGMIIVDSIYSTIGDICPLAEFVALAEETGSILIVDESHAVGVFGPSGAGLVASEGLQERVAFRTFSMSKAFVGRAGIVAGPARMLEFIRYESRPTIFSSAVLDHEIAGFEATLDVIRGADDRRARVLASAAALREGLVGLGYDLGPTETQIIPLVAGSEAHTIELRKALERRGIVGAVFTVPATPRNRALVRLSVTSDVGPGDVARVVQAMDEIRTELDPVGWPMMRPKGPRVRAA
jgi:CAI-1 autoinducer synthase